MSTTGWIVLGVIAVLVLGLIGIYNKLVAMRQRVSQAFADVDVQLKQRHDLVPNLVETVKGYAAPWKRWCAPVTRRSPPRDRDSRLLRRTCSPAPCGSCSRCRRPTPT